MGYETVEQIIKERDYLCAKVELTTDRVGSLTAEVEAQRQQISALVAEVERLKKELDAEREVSRVYHDLAEQLGKKASDARRTAMEEAKREYLRGVGDGAYLLPKVVAHVRVTYPNWFEADWTAEAIDAMQPGSNSSEAWFVEKLLAEEAAIRAAAKEER